MFITKGPVRRQDLIVCVMTASTLELAETQNLNDV